MSVTGLTSHHPSNIVGENSNLSFPTSIEALRGRGRGPEFLTETFRATGALGQRTRSRKSLVSMNSSAVRRAKGLATVAYAL